MPTIRHTPRAPTGTRALAPGGDIDPHRHDDHQLAYVGRGVVAMATETGNWVPPGSRALWIPAGCVHEHHARGDTELHLIGFPAEVNPLRLRAPATLAVTPLLRELILACATEPEDGSTQRARLRGVLLDRLRPAPGRPVRLPPVRDPRLAAVCAALRADPADDRTLAELGRAAGASARTLARLFRAETGMTFPQWRTRLRLQHALVLLAEGTPVTAVAHRCGWASASAFIDVFRAAFGHTPGTHLAP